MAGRIGTLIFATTLLLACGSSAGARGASSVSSSRPLVLAHRALPAGVPRLEVLPSGKLVGLGFRQGRSEPAASRIVFRVPAKYVFTPDANGAAPGSVIGSDVIVVAGQPQPLTGVLTMEDRAAFAAEGLGCTGSLTHDAVWAVSVPGPQGAQKLPIFVDGRSFTICPDVAKLGGTPMAVDLQLGLVGSTGVDRPLITTPSAAGRFLWSAIVSRSGLPDIEIRSVVALPQRASFGAKALRGSIRISGRITADRRGVAGVRVRAVVRSHRRGHRFDLYGRTRANGSFTLIHRLGRGSFSVRVNSYPEERDVTARACAAPSSAAGGCVSATEMVFGLQAAPAAIGVRSNSRPRT